MMKFMKYVKKEINCFINKWAHIQDSKYCFNSIFKNGVKAALLATTAMNQQKFMFTLSGSKVSVKAGMGFYTRLDLGIVKYHFEVGAGKDNFGWV